MQGEAWLVGVAINLIGSVLINLGTNVMKLGHNKREGLPQPATGCKPAVRTFREWQIGVALFSIGNVANFISFGYAAQSLLAAIGCIQFVSNVIFASLVLKERVSKGVLAATTCIVGGCILLVSFGSHSSQRYTYKQLLHLYSEPAYVAYMAVGAAVVLVAYAGFWFGQKAVVTKGPGKAQLYASALPVLYSLFSAIVGTQSVLFSKTLAVLLRATAGGDNQLTKWFTWIVLPAFLFTAVFWVSRLNKGLKMFPAMVIVPTLQICWTLFSILSGMLYFQEYQDMHALQAAMFVLGVMVVFAGVYLLTVATAASAARDRASMAAEDEGPLLLELAKAKVAYAQACFDKDDGPEEHELLVLARSNESAAGCLRGTAMLSQFRSSTLDSFTAELQEASANVSGAPAAASGVSMSAALAMSVTHPPHCDFAAHETEDDAAEEDYEQSLLAATSGSLPQHGWDDSSWGRFSQDSGLPGRNAAGSGGVSTIESHPASTSSLWQQQQQRLKERVSSLSRRVKADFSLDETAAAKLSLGLGDSAMPGVSLFAMPMADLNGGSPKVSVLSRRYGVLPNRSCGGAAEPPMAASRQHRGSFGTNYDYFGGRSGTTMESSPRFNRGINPLTNAIDVPTTAVTANNAVQGLDGLMEVAARSIKHNMQDIQATIKDLAESIQTAAERSTNRLLGGSGPARLYTRMTSHESRQGEMSPIGEASSGSDGKDFSEQPSPAALEAPSRATGADDL